MTELYVAGELRRLSVEDVVLFEVLCLFEGLHRLGFRLPEDTNGKPYAGTLHLVVGKIGDPSAALLPERARFGALGAHVTVRGWLKGINLLAQDASMDRELEEHFLVGTIRHGREDFDRAWGEAARVFARAPKSEAESLWRTSRALAALPDIARCLEDRGFALRR